MEMKLRSSALCESWRRKRLFVKRISKSIRSFRFATTYQVRPKKFKGEICEKTTIIYHAYLVRDVAIQVTEHPDYEWRPWDPPHRIQPETIDPLLERLERHLEQEAEG